MHKTAEIGLAVIAWSIVGPLAFVFATIFFACLGALLIIASPFMAAYIVLKSMIKWVKNR